MKHKTGLLFVLFILFVYGVGYLTGIQRNVVLVDNRQYRVYVPDNFKLIPFYTKRPVLHTQF